jgi:hypothetical protein
MLALSSPGFGLSTKILLNEFMQSSCLDTVIFLLKPHYFTMLSILSTVLLRLDSGLEH